MTYKVVDDIAASVEEKKGVEELPEEENEDEPAELVGVELVDDGEDEGEGEVEGEGGDGPGGEGKGGIQTWVWIPHVGHCQCKGGLQKKIPKMVYNRCARCNLCNFQVFTL